MSRSTRQRLRIAFVVIACLLFQQVALAAYACTLIQPPPDPMGMSADCAEMGDTQQSSTPAMCEKHCAPDRSMTTDHATLSVPAQALPPMLFATFVMLSISQIPPTEDVRVDRSDPPPRLRYCSLLI